MACKICGSELTYHDSGYFCFKCWEKRNRERKEKSEQKWSWLFEKLEQLRDDRESEEDKKAVNDLIHLAKNRFIGIL